MNKRKLGNTGIEVSEIAFGGVEIGLPYGIGIKSTDDMLPESDAIRLLRASLDAGINFFDTARMYGTSENLMGMGFLGRREEVVISTKCRHFRDATGKLPPNSKLEGIIETSLNESLKALQTNYLDVFMLHQADLEILDNDIIANVFQKLKASGIIRATGASTYTTQETEKALASGAWDVLQVPFNLMDQRQGNLFEKARRQGVGVVVRSVLMKGLLSDRGKNLHPALGEVERHIGRYHQLLEGECTSLPALATKFALSFEEVASVLVGMDRMEYLQQSLATADGRYLSPALLALAKQQAYPQPEFLDLPYWDRMGWLK
jgi:1-deoxyxylulose-5-phosphate synthase